MERFLVIQLARFGDVLQSGRLIRSLLAQGETHLCVDGSLAALAELVYPKARVHSLHAHALVVGTAASGVAGDGGTAMCVADMSVLRELAATTFSAVYNLNYSGLNRALIRLFDPAIVHGHGIRGIQELRARWLDMAFRWTRHRRSAPLNLVDIWAGLVPEPLAPEACTPPAVPGGRGLGVVLSGREARRSLPPEVLGPCVHALFEALDGPPVWLFGSAAERGLARKLLRHVPARVIDRVHDLSGRTSLVALHEALIGLDALLTPDTGIMHLAAQVGVPVQAMFLSSAWAWETGPYGVGHTVWQASAPCAPCLESAPCGEVACLTPFRQPALLRALSGRKKPEDIDGLWRLTSTFDRLGLDWSGAPDDEATSARQALRALVAATRSAGEHGDEQHGRGSVRLAMQADTFYQEADWMLPDPLP